MSKGGRSLIYYLVMLLVFGGLMYFIIKEGEARQIQDAIAVTNEAPHNLKEGFAVFKGLLMHHVESSIGILLLQIIVILITCRLFGWLFAKMQQPTVIGEIVAGIGTCPAFCFCFLISIGFFAEYKYVESVWAYPVYVCYWNGIKYYGSKAEIKGNNSD